MRRRDEPVGASAYLSAESDSWSMGGGGGGTGSIGMPTTTSAVRPRRHLAPGETCGFCHTTSMGMPTSGWIEVMQSNVESPSMEGKGETIRCRRGVLEDGAWFLVVDRDPLAEGHCKLICKEHVQDMLDLADWANRDL